MKSLLGWLAASLVLVLGASFAWNHMQRAAAEIAAPGTGQTQPTTTPEAEAAQKSVTLAGPLASYMSQQQAPKTDSVQTINYTPVASDHVGNSVVGTSLTIFHDKFRVASVVDVPFEVPAHAAIPQLHGTFQSFLQTGKPSSDTQTDVEFLLLSDQQYAGFLGGHPGEALFSAEATHDQEVNTTLPPTLRQPVKYHLVFRNSSRATRKVVEADFRIDF